MTDHRTEGSAIKSDTPLRYLSTLAFDEKFLDRIRAVSPRIVVQQITAESADDIPEHVWAQVDVLHTSAVFPPPGSAPALSWIQLDTSGADHLAGQPVWDREAKITTLGGVGPVAMAEYVMFTLLGMAHRLPELITAKSNKSWPSAGAAATLFTPAPVRGSTVVIIGYGRIGQEIGRVASAFGIRVIGVSRGGRTDPRKGTVAYDGRQVTSRPQTASPIAAGARIEPQDAHVVLIDAERLDEALPLADWLVVVVPRTAETAGLLDERRFSLLKPGAMLINVSRGGVVDETAMLDALRSGRLAGAVVDVFQSEPLEPESPWWTEPKVFLTPHVAGLTPDYRAHVEHIVTDNLRRFLAGLPLMNEIDRTRGY